MGHQPAGEILLYKSKWLFTEPETRKTSHLIWNETIPFHIKRL